MATNTSQSAGGVPPHMWGEPEPANTSQDEAVAGICEMFPDAHPEAVLQCLKSNGGSVGVWQEAPTVLPLSLTHAVPIIHAVNTPLCQHT